MSSGALKAARTVRVLPACGLAQLSLRRSGVLLEFMGGNQSPLLLPAHEVRLPPLAAASLRSPHATYLHGGRSSRCARMPNRRTFCRSCWGAAVSWCVARSVLARGAGRNGAPPPSVLLPLLLLLLAQVLAVVDREAALREITAHLTDICKTHGHASDKLAAPPSVKPLAEPPAMQMSESAAAISTLAPLLAAEPSGGFWSRTLETPGTRVSGAPSGSDRGRALDDDDVVTLSGVSERDRGSLNLSADPSDLNEAKLKAAEAAEGELLAAHSLATVGAGASADGGTTGQLSARGRAAPQVVAEWSPTNGTLLKHKRSRFAMASWQRRFFKFTRDCHLVWAKSKDAQPDQWKEGASVRAWLLA